MVREIPLTQGFVALVDDEDYDRVMTKKWCLDQSVRRTKYSNYAKSAMVTADGRKSCVRLHRFVMDAPTGMSVDHINGDGLDNRRANLRLATISQNRANRRKQGSASSRFLGVYWDKADRKWQVALSVSGQHRHIGYFTDEEEAARAYDAAAIVAHGEFASLNFPDDFAALRRVALPDWRDPRVA